MREYIDFLVQKLKEHKSSPLEALAAFIIAWACTDSTKSFSLTIRRMIGLPYVGKIEEAFPTVFARMSSDSAFKTKAIEALVLALEREWTRKDLLEAVWKNASKEMHDAIRALYEKHRSYTIKMFLSEVERVMLSQEEKTFETLPPPMGLSEEITLPAPPHEKAPPKKKIREHEELGEIAELFESIKTSLDTISKTLISLKDELAGINKTLKSLIVIFGGKIDNLQRILLTAAQISQPIETQRSEIKPVEETQVAMKIEEKMIEKPESQISESILSKEIIDTIVAEETPRPEHVMRHTFVCLGNLHKLQEMLRRNAIPDKLFGWSIKIIKANNVHETILQGLHKDISDEEFKDILNNGEGIIITTPIKSPDTLQRALKKLTAAMKNLKFLIIDGEEVPFNVEDFKKLRIILQPINSESDLERILDKIIS